MKLALVLTSILYTSISAFVVPMSNNNSVVGFSNKQTIQQLTHLQMFGGSGEEEEGEEGGESQEAKIEQAAKAMGMSKDEYKLVIKMQNQLATAVNAIRAEGEAEGVKITMDGNSPPVFFDVEIAAKDSKEKLEKGFVEAYKKAAAKAQEGQQAAIQSMNKSITEEMKAMGMDK